MANRSHAVQDDSDRKVFFRFSSAPTADIASA